MKTKRVKAKLPKFIRSITFVKAGTSSTGEAELERVTVEPKRKRKKQSRGIIRIWERVMRRGAEAQKRGAESYLERHERSNRKKKDGWLRDELDNLMRANRRGLKAFKLSKLLD